MQKKGEFNYGGYESQRERDLQQLQLTSRMLQHKMGSPTQQHLTPQNQSGRFLSASAHQMAQELAASPVPGNSVRTGSPPRQSFSPTQSPQTIRQSAAFPQQSPLSSAFPQARNLKMESARKSPPRLNQPVPFERQRSPPRLQQATNTGGVSSPQSPPRVPTAVESVHAVSLSPSCGPVHRVTQIADEDDEDTIDDAGVGIIFAVGGHHHTSNEWHQLGRVVLRFFFTVQESLVKKSHQFQVLLFY